MPIMTAADCIHTFLEKIRLDISCESSARQRIHKKHQALSDRIKLDISCESSARQKIHMKYQALFSSKDKSKKTKMTSAAIFVWPCKG